MSHKGIKYSLSSRFLFLLLTLISASSFAVDQTPPAQKLIRQMSEANHELNYEGVFIYRRHGKMDTMRIIHKVGENGIQERIVSLTGFAREVIRDKNSVTCILPDDESVMVEKTQSKTIQNQSVARTNK